jgi:hypothetical protein
MKRRQQERWLTPQEVGNMAGGFTAQFIRQEIKGGELPATLCMSQRGKLGRWRIKWADAAAYVARFQRAQTQTTQPSIQTP